MHFIENGRLKKWINSFLFTGVCADIFLDRPIWDEPGYKLRFFDWFFDFKHECTKTQWDQTLVPCQQIHLSSTVVYVERHNSGVTV